MVKRVKDLTAKPTDDVQVDPTKLAKEVTETTAIAQLSEEAHEQASARRPFPMAKRKITGCPLCELGVPVEDIRYFKVAELKRFMSLRGRILPRSKTGLCARHHRKVVLAIKRARQVALLPYLHTGMD